MVRLIVSVAIAAIVCGTAFAQDETPSAGLDFYGRGLVRDNIDLRFGTDGDVRIMYDETTDDRVEIHDGTNLLGWIKDQGSIADFYFSGAFTLDRGAVLNNIKGNYDVAIHGDTVDNIFFADASADVVNIIGGTLSLTTDLPVTSGGTGVSVLDDVVGTAAQITVTSGADSIIGGDVTLSLPSAVTLPGSLAVTTTAAITGATTMTGDLAVNGGDITSTSAYLNISGGATGVRVLDDAFYVHNTASSGSLNVIGGTSFAQFSMKGYRASSSPVGTNNVFYAHRGTESAALVVPSTTIMHRSSYYGRAWNGTDVVMARIDVLTDTGVNGAGTEDMPGEIQFMTTADEGTSPTVAITINSDKSMVGTGSWTTSGDLAVNGDDITSDGDMTITAGGGTGTITLDQDVTVSGTLTIGTAINVPSIYSTGLYNRLYLGTATEDAAFWNGDNDAYISIDSDNDDTTSFFEIETNGSNGLGTALLNVDDDGTTDVYGRFSPRMINLGNEAIPSATTIATGELTMSSALSFVVINGEGGAADTLDKVGCASCTVGDIIILMSDGDAITITDGFGGGAADSINISAALALDNIRDSLTIMRIAGNIWVEIARANNA